MDNNKLPRLDNRSKEELICNILLNYAFKNNNENILDTIISTLNLGEEIYTNFLFFYCSIFSYIISFFLFFIFTSRKYLNIPFISHFIV